MFNVNLPATKKNIRGGNSPPSERTKWKHGFHFLSLSLLSMLHPPPLPLWMTEHWCTPLEGTEWNELWPDACFLRKWSSSCLSLVSPTMLFQRAALFSLHVLCVVSEASKSAGCCGDEIQAHKETFLSTNQNTDTSAVTKTNCRWTQPRNEACFQNGI